MQIKVCGITNLEQATALQAMGVDYIGFIFYPASKRYVLEKLTLSDLATFKPVGVKKVGVFVNEPLDELLQIVASAGLDTAGYVRSTIWINNVKFWNDAGPSSSCF